MPELAPGTIHKEDVNQIVAVKEALNIHILENHIQFNKIVKHNKIVGKDLKEIKSTISEWGPYITDGMLKSEAYKYVAKDLKTKGEKLKWWVGFAIVFFSFMGSVYTFFEIFKITK